MPLTPFYRAFRKIDLSVIVPLHPWEDRSQTWGPLQGNVMRVALSKGCPSTELVLVGVQGKESILRNTPNTFKYVLCSHNIGVPGAWNVGASMSEGEVLLFLNDDCVPEPETIIRLYETLRDRPDVGMVGVEGHDLAWCGERPDGGPNPGCFRAIGSWGAPKYSAIPADGQDVTVVTGFCFAIRAADLIAIGKFDETFSPAFAEEYDAAFKVRNILKKRTIVIPGNVPHEIGASRSQGVIPYLMGMVDCQQHRVMHCDWTFHKRHFGT